MLYNVILNVINGIVYKEANRWPATDMACVSTPAVLFDVFFRVNITVRVSGSPANPQEVIERWVRVSHKCIISVNFR